MTLQSGYIYISHVLGSGWHHCYDSDCGRIFARAELRFIGSRFRSMGGVMLFFSLGKLGRIALSWVWDYITPSSIFWISQRVLFYTVYFLSSSLLHFSSLWAD